MRDLAFALLGGSDIKPIFERASIHDDVGSVEEGVIFDFVERYVEGHCWEKPDLANLVAATALVRQFAEGASALDDGQAQLDFIEDKRCDGLELVRRGRGRVHQPLKVSEVMPIFE
ncbi:hypothetical protein [Maritalea myrionectae]|uniref:hypothetical protein n=1 Tax=Maritalea myrionectae TaxID=454601 RepID=UPI000E3CF7C6|nr:hypothetical protein [Maritalea myrionectae]